MSFVEFMRSTAGRALRIVVGIALIVVAVVLGGVGGIVVGVIGGVFVLTGVVNVCLLGPLFSRNVSRGVRRISSCGLYECLLLDGLVDPCRGR